MDGPRQHQSSTHQQTSSGLSAEHTFATVVLDTIDTLLLVLDGNGRIIRFNQACQTLTGYTVAEVEGKRFWDLFFSPGEKTAVQAAFAKRRAAHFPPKSESYWLTKDGRRRLIVWSNTVLRDAAGEVAYVISAGTDVTEREQTALLLNASESLQRVTTALLQHLTTLDDVLAIVCTEARRLTEAAGSAVLLLEDENWVRVAGSSGHPPPALDRFPLADSFAGAVVAQRKPLLWDGTGDRAHAYHHGSTLDVLLGIPLCVDDAILGVLHVVNKPGGFTEADRRIMRLFAEQAAISIEHAQLHQQAEKLAVIEERQRLARELHDSVTQAIYSVILYADAAQMALASGKEDVTVEHIQELRNMAREAMLDMRLLIFELHPPVLEKEGLATAVQTRLETVEDRSGLQTTLHVEGKEYRLPISMEEDLYRIIQEALNNAVKHAQAERVTVRLQFGDHHFGLEVRDDGIGFDRDRAQEGGGVGLRGVAERAQRIGGELRLESAPGAGTTLRVEADF